MDDLYMKLKRMRFSGMADELKRECEDPNIDLKSAEDRIELLVNAEWNQRRSKKFNRLLRRSCLKYPGACFDESIYEPDRDLDPDALKELEKCQWINEGRNLLITGPTGTGKTWIACALAITAMKNDHSVRYSKASLLMNEMKRIKLLDDPEEIRKELNFLCTVDLLIIDDFGLMSLDIESCRSLFEILDGREARCATAVISQLPVKDWYDLFENDTYADACLDRLICRAYRLEFNGIDMRKKA